MFLNKLSNDEKNAFLELAHHIARSDDDFSEKQKTILQQTNIQIKVYFTTMILVHFQFFMVDQDIFFSFFNCFIDYKVRNLCMAAQSQ